MNWDSLAESSVWVRSEIPQLHNVNNDGWFSDKYVICKLVLQNIGQLQIQNV